jgi:hypothetical protein
MKYTFRFLGRAPADVQNLSPELRPEFWRQMDRLAEAPVTLSIPGAPPASLPNRQIFPFRVTLPDGRQFTIRVHFRYDQDEVTLAVIRVTVLPHGGPPPK